MTETERAMAGFYTVAELAAMFGRSENTITLWCRQDRFPGAFQLPQPNGRGRWLVPEADLENFEPPKQGRPFQE